MLNVFHRDGERIRHFWASELFYAPTDPGQDPRHVGTLEPVWNLFDLTAEGPPDRLGRAAELLMTPLRGGTVEKFIAVAKEV